MLDRQETPDAASEGSRARTPAKPLPDVDHLSTAQILAHPRWTQARDCYMQMALDSQRPDPAIRRVMQDIARIVLFNIIIGLHEARDEARQTWATINHVREAFEPFGLASPRRFDEMIARMRIIGLIELQPSPSDRRMRLVVPTERMIAEDYAWHDFNMRALAVLRPDSRDYDEVFTHNLHYRKAHRLISAGIHARARAILDTGNNPLVALLVRQDGSRIVFSYLLAAVAGGDPSRASLGFDAVSARISTSRTHVRNMVSLLETHGYVRRHGAGGRDIELLPQLWQQAELFVASILSGNDYWWQLTRARVAAGEQSTQ